MIKSKRFFLVAVAISASIFISSCTKDDDKSEASSVPTTSVAFTPIIESTGTTNRDVNRGNIYVWVKDITLNAQNVQFNSNVSDLFNLVGPSSNAAPSGFVLDNVPVGSTNFTATTTSYVANKIFSLSTVDGGVFTGTFPVATSVATLATLVAKNPYAVYSSPVVNQVVNQTGANILSMPLHTQQGRLTSVIYMEQIGSNFDEQFEATISVTAQGETTVLPAVLISDGKLAKFEWSNDNSLDNKVVTYTIVVRPKNHNNAVTPTTYTITEDIEKSVSKNCIYMISKDKAPVVQRRLDNITFTFDQWQNGTCNDCH